jgi:hypothetical protein
MPTGLLPEPLRAVANNLFGRQGSDMSPKLTLARACLPLEPPRPLGVLWVQIGGGAYGLRYCRSLHRDRRHRVRRCLSRRLHPPEEEARPGFDEVPQLCIDPVECIDCGACVPVSAIFDLDDLPETWKNYTELNARYVQGGKFTPEEYAKHNARLGRVGLATTVPEESN